MVNNKSIISQKENFAEWYTSVIINAKLVTYSNIKGCINYLPNGWAIWENIKYYLDNMLKQTGVENVQLPPFISLSQFSKESKHIEGFAPEAIMITKKGSEELIDPYILRPTSEVLFSEIYHDLVKSYNNLPIKYNQWCPAYRVEKTTKPFLRGVEFHWHELHCLFETEKEARKYTLDILDIYKKFFKDVCNIEVLSGEKTIGERFAGAEQTNTCEIWSLDNQCVQAATSHYLGLNFSKIYDIKFQDLNNTLQYPHYTSHGASTRIIGSIIVSHSDDKGLVLPFKLAKTQISILAINPKNNPKISKFCEKIKNDIIKKYNYRVEIDNSDKSFGYKISNQEVIGTPISLIIGEKDIENKSLMLITRNDSKKIQIKISELLKKIPEIIEQYSNDLYLRSKKDWTNQSLK